MDRTVQGRCRGIADAPAMVRPIGSKRPDETMGVDRLVTGRGQRLR